MKILFGSMKHRTAGRHSSFMPLAIGFISSYLRAYLREGDTEIALVEEPDDFLARTEGWNPDVIAVSNYCWNAELNYALLRRARRLNPHVVTLGGGPEMPIPEVLDECETFLRKRPWFDFYVFGEGEVATARLFEKLAQGAEPGDLKAEPQPGIIALHPRSGKLVKGERPDRLMNMDEIPSPYTSGLMEPFFDGTHAPMVQLARGCPFRCAFCDAAQDWYNRVASFSIPRIREELTYVADRMRDHPNILLAITDSNFGMYKQDEEVAAIIRELQDSHGWPNAIDVTTGKAKHDRILAVSDIMRNKFQIYSSTQSMNQETLDVIKRKNVGLERWHEVVRKIRNRGMETAADYIIPMPKETKQSFLDGMRVYIEAGVDLIVPLTLVMLKGTPLASRENRASYGMTTKWRLVSRSHGIYAGETVFEVEEVCIATNTMSFQDYLDCRGFSFVSVMMVDPQYDIIYRHLDEWGISRFDFIQEMWHRIAAGGTAISPIYDEFIRQTAGELFDSEQELQDHYKNPENYRKLVTGEEGDNLLRRFKGLVVLGHAREAVELAYEALEDLARDRMTGEDRGALAAARRWAVAIRNVSEIFAGADSSASEFLLDLDYDIGAWYEDGRAGGHPLSSYRRPTRHRLWYDRERIRGMLDTGEKMYGPDKLLSIPRLLLYYNVKHFWRTCDSIGLGGSDPSLRSKAGALEWKRENWVA